MIKSAVQLTPRLRRWGKRGFFRGWLTEISQISAGSMPLRSQRMHTERIMKSNISV